MKQKWTIRIARFLVLVLCLAAVVGCNSEAEPLPRADSDPFSRNLALELARLNLYAYDQLRSFLDDTDFTLPAPYRLEEELFTAVRFAGDIFSNNQTVTLGFIATSGNAIYVVFRGTEAISEWLANVTFPQENFTFVAGSGRTHQGFTNVYQSIRQVMIDRVRNLINTGSSGGTEGTTSSGYTTLYVIGHSLGGAIAILAALELQERTTLEPIMYNFAAPRVGDPDFRDSYLAAIRTSWRVVNTNDVVPDVPPTSILAPDDFPPRTLSYRHVFSAREVTFGRLSNPLDVLRIRSNHGLCNYYNALCDESNDPASCRELAGGVDDCNP